MPPVSDSEEQISIVRSGSKNRLIQVPNKSWYHTSQKLENLFHYKKLIFEKKNNLVTGYNQKKVCFCMCFVTLSETT